MLYPSHGRSSLCRIIKGCELSPLIGITSIPGSHTPPGLALLPRPQMFDVCPDASAISICSQRSCLRGGRREGGMGRTGGARRAPASHSGSARAPGAAHGAAAASAPPGDPAGRFAAWIPLSLPTLSRCCSAAGVGAGRLHVVLSPPGTPSLAQPDTQLFAQGWDHPSLSH